ncbi:hypothetical protein [Rhodoblastus sp.]|uniref:hypothetical protein n=1 Tax=Rhodoblastus sp. TaxID=1962975 RepID=UPI0025E722AF|nr:hypothetical protein [Rhodoblastus sp.]
MNTKIGGAPPEGGRESLRQFLGFLFQEMMLVRRPIRRNSENAMWRSVFLVLVLLSSPAHADERYRPALNPAVTQATIAETICTPGWTRTIRPYVSEMKRIKAELLTAIGEPIEHRN